jgi:type VI secretion system protein ImpK
MSRGPEQQSELEEVVYPVFRYGLRLWNRLDRGEKPDLELEQSELKGLLGTTAEARRSVAFGGDGRAFLGIRYAQVCWLDELFICGSAWSAPWTERKLEEALYGTNDRAWKFWEQYRLAEASSPQALEAFYLCVLLGFRGELQGDPARLQAWRESAEAQLNKGRQTTWAGPPELPAVTNVLPLQGRERLRRALLLAGVGLGLGIYLAAFLTVYLLGRY